mmetsp:Transcript_21451/g.44699  ORF Transcript_21451/g.44699 Transcript_21451/m.44699 type:complete len:439 (+) Transcript_21451:105-1421(+)
MVEGHSVHRVAHRHRTTLVGSSFKASSPNSRFSAGAGIINALTFCAIEAVGKNLFAFFGDMKKDPHVVHVHFGMSGAWAIHPLSSAPPPTATTRLRLEGPDSKGKAVVVDLSAMTCNIGGMELYDEKRAKLGEDPLRADADPERLWGKVSRSKKGIGALIMDQSFFTGPGNIYRAEILLKAGVHPSIPGNRLSREAFDRVWLHTVELLQRGYATGSILTVDADDAVGRPGLRRYIYNSSRCGKCGGKVKSWDIAGRTCYACESCQPPNPKYMDVETKPKPKPKKEDKDTDSGHVPFISHCAKDSMATRLERGGARLLTVAEIKSHLVSKFSVTPPKSAKKAELAALLDSLRAPTTNAEEAAKEKAEAGEARNVEHVAELAPGQARRAATAKKEETSPSTPNKKIKAKPERPTKKRKAGGVKVEKRKLPKRVNRGKLLE